MEDVIELKTKVQEKLKLYGLRPTRARTRIGMMLLDKPKHLSADQVHEKLKQKIDDGPSHLLETALEDSGYLQELREEGSIEAEEHDRDGSQGQA